MAVLLRSCTPSAVQDSVRRVSSAVQDAAPLGRYASGTAELQYV